MGDAPPPPAGVTLAFALPRGALKPRATVPVNAAKGEAARDFVSAMGGGALASVNDAPPPPPRAPLVIPALANTFETGKGKRRGVRARARARGSRVCAARRFSARAFGVPRVATHARTNAHTGHA
jgi:hypothetical protein